MLDWSCHRFCRRGFFFRLGIEQRLREVRLFHAMGYLPKGIRSLFLSEGAVLAIVGSLLGLGGAVGYAWLIMLGLKTWWVDSVVTRLLTPFAVDQPAVIRENSVRTDFHWNFELRGFMLLS